MDIKNKVIELTTQLSEINYDSEEDNLTKENLSGYQNNFEEDQFEQDSSKSKLRSINTDISLNENIYEGRTISRQRNDSYDSNLDETLDLEGYTDDDSENRSDFEEEEGEKEKGGGREEEEEEIDSGSDEYENDSENDIRDIPSSKTKFKKELDNKDYNIYSSKTRNVKEDIKKGISIKNQLGIWETLLECRIKLQKSLTASNKLPQRENFLHFTSLYSVDDNKKVKKTNRSVMNLLSKLDLLQEKLLDQSPEYNSNSKSKLKNGEGSEEEIPSSSENDEDKEEDNKEDNKEPAKKKLKLNQYSEFLKDNFQDYLTYRNMSIQKWNDKTKISSGKIASSNFSAFDQSTIKQIEQIMIDKDRLINRTQIKRSQYRILGKQREAEVDPSKQEIDKEIFDDDDFYHKLLRDFIEKKSIDGLNSAQTERQWMELQKLRSKMKKKVDTKSTKGRKIRYVVIPKLVNFMTPVTYTTWNENAESELYNSLFGKITTR